MYPLSKHVRLLLDCCGKPCLIGPLTLNSLMYVQFHPRSRSPSSFLRALQAISDLIRSITSLPSEITLISLPPAPLLELVCLAADRQLTAVWLTLVSRLVVQLEPPSFISLKTEPAGDTKQLVDQAARSIVISSIRVLQVPGVMEEVCSNSEILCTSLILFQNPDLVQAFFSCVESVGSTGFLNLSQLYSRSL